MRFSCLYGALVFLLAASFALGEDRSSAASFSPSCPETQIVAGKFQFPAIVFRYNPSSPDAELKSPGELNLRIADLSFQSGVPVQSIPMTRQPDGTWSTELRLNGMEASYFVFYFEDGLHRVDRNHGNYWDILGCSAGEPSAAAVMQQAMTWQGKLAAPGIERQFNLDRANAILRDDLAVSPITPRTTARSGILNWSKLAIRKPPSSRSQVKSTGSLPRTARIMTVSAWSARSCLPFKTSSRPAPLPGFGRLL